MSLGDKLAASMAKVQEADLRHSEKELELVKEMLRYAENQKIMYEIEKLRKSRDEAVALNKEYEELLSKPMIEIASHKLGKNFQPEFVKSQKLITNWIVSQKAYREIAIQYGEKLGKIIEEVGLDANKQKIWVIENLTNPAHQTGMEDLADFPVLKEAAIENAKKTTRTAQEDFETATRELTDPEFKENRRREAAEKAAAEKAAAEKAAAEKAAAEEARKKSYEDAKKAAAEYDRKMEEQKAAAKKAAAEKDLAERNSRFRWRVGVFSVLGLVAVKYIFF